MTMKRWIAIIVAAALIFVSIGVNSLSYIFTRDFNGLFEEMMATSSSGYSETIIEEGTGKDKIAVLHLDGVIQDLGNASSLFSRTGYNHQFFMNQLNEILEDHNCKRGCSSSEFTRWWSR